MKRTRVLLLLLLPALAACNRDEQPAAPASTATSPAAAPAAAGAGNAGRGRELVSQYGCNVCHAVPGVDGPQGSLGPSLAGLASRPAISFGTVANTPANLTRFIQDPASLNPGSSMPPLNITPADAQDLTAYLLTLK